MIIKGEPELGLQKHQQEAYREVTKAFENGENKASVVIPTGCGKSFISLQLMVDNKDSNILFMAPTNAIKDQMYRYIAKYIVGEAPTKERPAKMIAEEYFPNLKIILYQSLLRIKNEVREKLKPDVIIMDELHRTGADKWGEKIDELLEKNPEAKVLGLTATPDRMDDKDVIDRLFEGNVNYELTLVEAIRRGIVKAPSYVKCDYALRDSLETVREKIENCEDEKTRKELEEKYDKMRRIVENAEGIPELFCKNLTKKDGKYIVFCKDKEHMEEMIEKAKEWFAEIDKEPEIYSVYSKYGDKQNKQQIKHFENSKSEHVKLLFSVDMLNEGLHVEDISGVIMLRPTESRIIYLQQLGRALSSDTTRQKTIIFDLVNNYLKNNLDAELNKKIVKDVVNVENTERVRKNVENYDGQNGQDDIQEDIDIFRIVGETKEFLELFEQVEKIAGGSEYLKSARKIKEWIEKSGGTKPPSQQAKDKDEQRLGVALANIRQHLIKPYLSKETEERGAYRKKYPEIDEILSIVNEIDENNISPYLVKTRKIKEWIEKSGGKKPPSPTSKDEEEKRKGMELNTIRQNRIKPFLELQTEEEREAYRKKYPEIDEILSIVNEIDENNISPYLVNAREIKEWIERNGETKLPSISSKDKEERRLGTALATIRQYRIKPYLSNKTDEEREAYRKKYPEIDEVIEIINGIDRKCEKNIVGFLVKAREIKEWMEKSGETKPPSAIAKDEKVKKLGEALASIRKYRIKPYLELQTEEERKAYKEKNPEIDEILEIVNEIDDKNISEYLLNARAIKEWIEKSGGAKPPAVNSKDAEEKRLGDALSRIRQNRIKPYLELETEEERKKIREENPEIDEILSIVNEIDENNISPYLVNAREIKEWIEKSGGTKLPVQQAKDEEEKRLGVALADIRKRRIKPYLSKKTEEEREAYRKKYPEIDEILEIVNEIDEKSGRKKLGELVSKDAKKRKTLQEAKELESSYEQKLKTKTDLGKTQEENTGVSIDGE